MMTTDNGEGTMEQPDNVVIFPKPHKNRPVQNFEEICRNVEMAKVTHIDEVAEEIVVEMMEKMFEKGYDFSERSDADKDIALLFQALKSVLHKHDGLSHPFHNVSESFFVPDKDGDLMLMMPESTTVEITETIEEETK